VPEISACLWQTKKWATVPVPEASMHENRGVEPGKHNVRPPWQTSTAQPISEPSCVQGLADHQFDLCVRPPDPRHLRGSLFWREDVNQNSGGFLLALSLRHIGDNEWLHDAGDLGDDRHDDGVAELLVGPSV
jgi:hypothetical protein